MFPKESLELLNPSIIGWFWLSYVNTRSDCFGLLLLQDAHTQHQPRPESFRES